MCVCGKIKYDVPTRDCLLAIYNSVACPTLLC